MAWADQGAGSCNGESQLCLHFKRERHHLCRYVVPLKHRWALSKSRGSIFIIIQRTDKLNGLLFLMLPNYEHFNGPAERLTIHYFLKVYKPLWWPELSFTSSQIFLLIYPKPCITKYRYYVSAVHLQIKTPHLERDLLIGKSNVV